MRPVYGLGIFIPAAVGSRAGPRLPHADLRGRGARRDPHGSADGRVHRAPCGQDRARPRRAAERDVRQRAGADHRLLRPERRAPGGRQGLDRRLDHRQHPAGARCGDAGRRAQARQADLQPHGRHRPGGHAAAGADRADPARRVPARARRRPARRQRGAGGLRLRPRAPLVRRRDHPDGQLRGRPDLLPAHPPGRVQPLRRAGRGGRARRGVVDEALADLAGAWQPCWSA